MVLKLLGAALMVSPLAAMFVFIARADGWRVALAAFGIMAAILAAVAGGALLFVAGGP